MKPSITDLSKWAQKTGEAVKRICGQKEGLPIAFAICFFDPMATEDKQWNFVIELAFDPNNPPPEEDQKKLRLAMEHIMDGVAQIYQADKVEDMEDFTAKGSFH